MLPTKPTRQVAIASLCETKSHDPKREEVPLRNAAGFSVPVEIDHNRLLWPNIMIKFIGIIQGTRSYPGYSLLLSILSINSLPPLTSNSQLLDQVHKFPNIKNTLMKNHIFIKIKHFFSVAKEKARDIGIDDKSYQNIIKKFICEIRSSIYDYDQIYDSMTDDDWKSDIIYSLYSVLKQEAERHSHDIDEKDFLNIIEKASKEESPYANTATPLQGSKVDISHIARVKVSGMMEKHYQRLCKNPGQISKLLTENLQQLLKKDPNFLIYLPEGILEKFLIEKLPKNARQDKTIDGNYFVSNEALLKVFDLSILEKILDI